MKKYVIAFGVIDQPSFDDDGPEPIYGVTNNLFNTEEEAHKYLEEVEIPNMIKEQKSAYFDEDLPDEEQEYSIEVEDGMYDKREVVVYYDGDKVNTISYQVIGIDVMEAC